MNHTHAPLSIKEAAARLHVGRKRLSDAIKAGQINAPFLGKRRVVPIAEINRFATALAG